jgi:16S rRNA G966 N2-methylase RsmD
LGGITLVDYGGGSGFLSLLAKAAGIGRVIYIDINPQSVSTARLMAAEAGVGPDVFLTGDSGALAAYCSREGIRPEWLIGTDVIEHIYRLPPFFEELTRINPRMEKLFTTASTPFNPLVRRRLLHFMDECENSVTQPTNYLKLRRRYLSVRYPYMTDYELYIWSAGSRGLTYADMAKAVKKGELPYPEDGYNTCDPETGNWAERLLPMAYYQLLADEAGQAFVLSKGFYNVHRRCFLLGWAVRLLNVLIALTGTLGLKAAPFIFLGFRNDHQGTGYAAASLRIRKTAAYRLAHRALLIRRVREGSSGDSGHPD